MTLPKLPQDIHDLVPQIETPAIIYFESIIAETVQIFKKSITVLNPILFYAVKAVSFPFILKILYSQGINGFDVASFAEACLVRNTFQNFEKLNIQATTPGLTPKELSAFLKLGCTVNCDSITQVRNLLTSPNFNHDLSFGLRINPGIDIKNKFGYQFRERESRLGIRLEDLSQVLSFCSQVQHFPDGIHLHLDVGITTLDFHKESLVRLMELIKQNPKIAELFRAMSYLNMGGGLIPVFFNQEFNLLWKYFDPKSIPVFHATLDNFRKIIGIPQLKLIFELGEFFTESAGFFIARVVDKKLKPSGQKVWILDTNIHHHWGFAQGGIEIVNDCIYPAQSKNGQPIILGGNSCYRDDTIGTLMLDPSIDENKVEYLIISERGAYYFARASMFNGRMRPYVYLLDQNNTLSIKHRDTMDLFYRWWE